MSRRVQVLAGSAQSGREHAIHTLMAQRWGASLLIVPTREEARRRAQRLILEFELPGAVHLPAMSFEDFASTLIRESGVFPHVLDDFERLLLVQNAVAQLRRNGDALAHLGDAAESPGFANHVLRIITELKQAAVEPAAFRAVIERRSRPSWLDGIVLNVYETYQTALQQSDAYDHVGLYWQAHVILAQQQPALFRRVRTLIFDGFDDFTPSEFRVVERAGAHVDEIVVGLACDLEDPSRQDLFAMPRATLKRLQDTLGEVHVRTFPTPPIEARSAYVAQHLFWRDKPVEPDALIENVELCACHDIAHECETIGRRVKRLLVDDGAKPETIAVVYRRLDPVAARLRLAFDEYGIPYSMQYARPLTESSIGAFVLGLYDVAEAWERDDVLDALTSVWFGAPTDHAATFGILVRQSGVIRGQHEWLSSIENMVNWIAGGQGEAHARTVRRLPEAAGNAQSLLEEVRRLETLLRLLPDNATRAEHSIAAKKILAKLRVDMRIDYLPEGMHAPEQDALAAMQAVLNRFIAWEGRLGLDERVPRAEFATELQRALDLTPVSELTTLGGVQIIDAAVARHREYDHLFLGGLNEGSFPVPPTADAIFNDADRADLRQAGAPIEPRGRYIEREMLLLHHVLDRASTHATILWSMVDMDGRSLAPSPFVDDIRGLCKLIDAKPAISTSFLPTLDEAACARDMQLIDELDEAVESAFCELFEPLRVGAGVERERCSPMAFGCYDGVLSDAELVGQLAAVFGPDHVFSALQLEQYAQCPFRFFIERILRIESVEPGDEAFDPRTRGRAMHEVLQKFHTYYRGIPGSALPEDSRDVMTRLFEETFDAIAKREVAAPPGVVAVERERLLRQLHRYVDVARETAETWQPTHFEVAFGGASGSKDPLSRSETYLLNTPGGDVQLSGRIDRIDLDGRQARIVDYKTSGNVTKRDILAGVHLQLPLYAVVLRDLLLPGFDCTEAVLIIPGQDKPRRVMRSDVSEEDRREREDAMRDSVRRCVDGIRAGIFPPTPYPSPCKTCILGRPCRHEQWRVELKSEPRDVADE